MRRLRTAGGTPPSPPESLPPLPASKSITAVAPGPPPEPPEPPTPFSQTAAAAEAGKVFRPGIRRTVLSDTRPFPTKTAESTHLFCCRSGATPPASGPGSPRAVRAPTVGHQAAPGAPQRGGSRHPAAPHTGHRHGSGHCGHYPTPSPTFPSKGSKRVPTPRGVLVSFFCCASKKKHPIVCSFISFMSTPRTIPSPVLYGFIPSRRPSLARWPARGVTVETEDDVLHVPTLPPTPPHGPQPTSPPDPPSRPRSLGVLRLLAMHHEPFG